MCVNLVILPVRVCRCVFMKVCVSGCLETLMDLSCFPFFINPSRATCCRHDVYGSENDFTK